MNLRYVLPSFISCSVLKGLGPFAVQWASRYKNYSQFLNGLLCGSFVILRHRLSHSWQRLSSCCWCDLKQREHKIVLTILYIFPQRGLSYFYKRVYFIVYIETMQLWLGREGTGYQQYWESWLPVINQRFFNCTRIECQTQPQPKIFLWFGSLRGVVGTDSLIHRPVY